jgi:hypothetical protein
MSKIENSKTELFVRTSNEKVNVKSVINEEKITNNNNNSNNSNDQKSDSPPLDQSKLTIKTVNPKDPNYKKRIILNARGTRYDVLIRIFDKYPQSRLGKLKKLIEKEGQFSNDSNDLCDDYDLNKLEFYFNRDPFILNYVLNFYEDNKIHYDDRICSKFFLHELKYWGLNEFMFDNDCKCQMNFFIQREECSDNLDEQERIIYELYHEEDFGCVLPKIREYIWGIVDKPKDPFISKV